uniref:TPS37 n=1 Tax=Juglans sigillata TaxID=224355 RepID=A0A8K2AHJ0_9ROSI|nr:TPS37 [Juglans sigillata]
MALHSTLSSLPVSNFARQYFPSKTPMISHITTKNASTSITVNPCPLRCMASSPVTTRRDADYQPALWKDDYILSLTSEYVGESYTRRADQLKAEVRIMFDKVVVDPLEKLELIDVLQKLGLSYHFEDEVKRTLEAIYNTIHQAGDICKKENLYAISLEFRLLRQHGYSVPQEIFNIFMNENGKFKASLCDDPKGLLYLFEASFLSIEGETILDEARAFATKQLKEYVEQNKSQNLSTFVGHALELPLHWRMLRSEARWFIDTYRREVGMNPVMLELAELDFNMVQAVHQQEVKRESRWWKSTGLGEKLGFARDRLMVNFLWAAGQSFQPHYGYGRRMITRVFSLITTIDDIYDLYGSLDELELFTDVIERWDLKAIDRLPYYMQICFLALNNFVNEMAFDILKEQEFNVIQYLRKVWIDQCRSYLVEAKWYYMGYTPTLQEYLKNAWISISGPVMLAHAYCFTTVPITKESLASMEDNMTNIIYWSSMILRLANDLGTSSVELKKGDIPKSIQCYMNETGASEKDAREHIRYLISEAWKKMNKERATSSSFSQAFMEYAMNMARTAQWIYQYGDGYGIQDRETRDNVLSLLINPVPLRT